jgi:hypothetical protein
MNVRSSLTMISGIQKMVLGLTVFFAAASTVRSQVPLPEGAEKATVESVCTVCHTTERIVTSQRSLSDWQDVIREMIRNGAELPESKIEPVVAYLANNFPPPAGSAGATPRTPDGTPDLSGTWLVPGGPRHIDLEMTTWGEAQYLWNTEPIIHQGYFEPIERQRIELDPVFNCYPLGLTRLGPPNDDVMGASNAMEIIQTPSLVTIIYQHRNSIRYIHLDERDHPRPLELTWNGHSIGRWDGDTLVVDTVGIRDETWITSDGHEHSAQFHVVERFQRLNAGSLEVERTLTDPVALSKPYTGKVSLRWNPKYDLNENRGQNDCSQYMVRKPGFGKGMGGLLGISDHP